jgi:hypothetical protein
MDAIEEIRGRDLRQYLIERGFKFTRNKTICPFHNDTNPSLDVAQKNGSWVFHCFGCEAGGSIIDFVSKYDEITIGEAIKKLKKHFGLNDQPQTKPKPRKVAEYSYCDESGKLLYKILRFHPKDFRADRKMNGIRRVPYRWPEVLKAETVWMVEGEKDADKTRKLGLTATTFPFGVENWKREFAEFFKRKNVRICLDKGTEKEAQRRAKDLKKIAKSVKIIELPGLDKDGQDITDWIERQDTKTFEELGEWLQKIADETPEFGTEGLEAETVEEILKMAIPPIEWQIKSLAERRGYTLIGAIKGVGKSLFVTSLGLHYAAGKPFFMLPEFEIDNPGRVLYVQQEVSLSGMKDRLYKMQRDANFNLEGRFRQKTTTGQPWNLNEEGDREKLIKLVEFHRPDMLILDPLYTFCVDVNNLKAVSEVMSFLLQLKTDYDLGLVVVHHFSNKPKDDVFISTVGRFMGSSNIANAADVTIAMEFLGGEYKHQNLELPYNHYATVEVTTRHGEWPQKFAAERKDDGLLFHHSGIWDEMGKKIMPDQILRILAENSGEMLQKDLTHLLTDQASYRTIHKAIVALEEAAQIERFNINYEGRSMKKLRVKNG